jgi:shikimate kinase
VVLIGPPGAGKSAVGPLLADRLGVEFRDTDAEVGAAAGKPVGDIFIENGEEAFRELERSAATTALGVLREHGGVLALGSGAVLDAGIQALLGGRPVVYLSADFGTVARRTGLGARPLLLGNARPMEGVARRAHAGLRVCRDRGGRRRRPHAVERPLSPWRRARPPSTSPPPRRTT